MVDYDNDGLGESADMAARVTGMAALQVLEAAVRARRERMFEEQRAADEAAREHRTRYEAQAALARAELKPVMGDRFWKDADLDTVRDRFVQAEAFARVDESFAPYRDRIAERVSAMHGGMTTDELLEGPVPPGPRPMTDEQVQSFMGDVAPEWYRRWAAQELQQLAHIDSAQDERAAHVRLNDTIRADLEHWRDRGSMSEHAAGVQERWAKRELGTWRDRRVDAAEPFKMLTDDQRRGYGWRPGGPKLDGPLSVDDARLLAATTAPGWYRVQDLVATDLPHAVREKTEGRLVADMTSLRDRGVLDTPSAHEEWARFSGHPMSAAEQDPNETLSVWQERRAEAFRVHWAATEPDRDRISEPGGHHVGKPMSVPEAEEFAERFAPSWVRDRHAEVLDEIASTVDDPDRVAVEQTAVREQFRFAMEEARDAGTLSHSYVAGLRDRTAFLGLDESEGMRHVPSAERVRFGGPEARPMTNDEAMEVMSGWAPEWYQTHVRRSVRDNTMLSESARRSVMDSVRADMTVLRDRGVLATDHAQRVWAASQPGFDPSDPDSRRAMDRREQLWVETSGRREGPTRMDRNNRERLGGAGALDTRPVPVVTKPQEAVREAPTRGKGASQPWPVREPGAGAGDVPREVAEAPPRRKSKAWDTPARRNSEAAAARAAGHSSDAVDGMTAADYGRSKRPVERTGGKPAGFEEWREAARTANRQRDADLGR